jgi:NAD(P)-dependent dehydrogenase (short-subunit alcohol dehydrogenase family)
MQLPWNKKRKGFKPGGWFYAGLGTILALSTLNRLRQRRVSFRDRVVMITGGSRGLGLQMARLLADEGARLALLARNEPELEAARRELAEKTEVLAIPTDVSLRADVTVAVAAVIARFGRIDTLINNAGIIQVGPIDHMSLEDYQNAMDIHFWGPLYAMLAVIPVMRKEGGGQIVNISSIGGEVAVPHLAPYVASKFALVGLSDAFRAELAKDGISVTTVSPGLMRTGSYYHANFKGQNKKEFAWFSMMSSTPLTAMSSRRAAKQVLNAARTGAAKRTLTLQARTLEILDEVVPGLTAFIARQASRRMPAPVVGGDELRTGFESRSNKSPTWVTKMGDRAAEQNNEMMAEKVVIR